MPKSRRRKKNDERCRCGQAHVVAVFHRFGYDELEMPVELHAFASCDEWGEWVDNLPPGFAETYCAEIMSTHVIHHANWLKAYSAKRQFDEVDPMDPEVLRKLRGEDQP
jgi:hypothetical protein